MKVVVDTDLCQGHGMCVLESPAVFDLGKGESTVTIGQAEVPEERLAEVRQAVKYCPNAALSLED